MCLGLVLVVSARQERAHVYVGAQGGQARGPSDFLILVKKILVNYPPAMREMAQAQPRELLIFV